MAVFTAENGASKSPEHPTSDSRNPVSIGHRAPVRSADLSDDEILGLGVRSRDSKGPHSASDGLNNGEGLLEDAFVRGSEIWGLRISTRKLTRRPQIR
jgi:hypothetical protein